MSVYFAERDGLIKIGWSRSVPARMYALKAKLIGAVKGERLEEIAFHARFNHLHVRGEWFRPGDDLRAYIRDEAQGHKPDCKNVQTAVRLFKSDLKLADKIADRMSAPGFPVMRSAVLRIAVTEGLKELAGRKKR